MYLQTIFSTFFLNEHVAVAVYTNVWKYELSETVSRSLSVSTGVT